MNGSLTSFSEWVGKASNQPAIKGQTNADKK